MEKYDEDIRLSQKFLSFYDDPFCGNRTKKLLRQSNTTAIERNDVRLDFIPDRDQQEMLSRFRLSLIGLKIVVITCEHVCSDQKHLTIHVQNETHKN